MGFLLTIGRGTILTAVIILALALLKKMVIIFGFLFAFIKFGIIIAFTVLLASIAIAIIRDWSNSKNGPKTV
jgi:hypothetical protein